MMKGRPILGVISGFFFGLFSGISLFLWGVIDFHSSLFWILPVVGIVLGLAMASWAPFGGGSEQAPASESTTTETPAPPPPEPSIGESETDETA